MTALAQADIDLLVIAAVCAATAVACFVASFIPHIWRTWRGR